MERLIPAEYRLYVRMSTKRHILVEGKTDKVAFDFIKNEIQNGNDIEIENAENLIKFEDDSGNTLVLGNRNKVELITQSIVEQSRNFEINGRLPYADKFVGFVDREMREFIVGETIQDLLNCHNVIDRLVWSRGHSIENYLLDLDILCDPFRISSPNYSNESHRIINEIWISMLRLSCAASITAWENGKIKLITNSIVWELLEIDPPHVLINLDRWRQGLQNSNLRIYEVDELIERFVYWIDISNSVELPTLRWICHGHLVFNLLWNVFAACVYVISNDSTFANKSLRDKESRYNSCMLSWSKRFSQGRLEFPYEVFRLLGFEI